MKLKDLLEELKDLDPEATVFFQMNDGCCGEVFDLDDPYIDATLDTHKKDPITGKSGWVKAEGNEQSVRIILPALPMVSSCIKSGMMKDLYNKRFDENGKWRKEWLDPKTEPSE